MVLREGLRSLTEKKTAAIAAKPSIAAAACPPSSELKAITSAMLSFESPQRALTCATPTAVGARRPLLEAGEPRSTTLRRSAAEERRRVSKRALGRAGERDRLWLRQRGTGRRLDSMEGRACVCRHCPGPPRMRGGTRLCGIRVVSLLQSHKEQAR